MGMDLRLEERKDRVNKLSTRLVIAMRSLSLKWLEKQVTKST